MLRSKAYNIFIIFFFVVSLILSGCRTTRHIRENEEDSQLITVNNQPSADSLQPSADSVQLSVDSVQLPADSVQLPADSVQLSADSVQLSAVSQQPIAKNQKPKAKSQESFIEDKIERSCNDSTVQDFKNNKIYYYGGAKVVYEDITIEADFIEFDFEKRTVFALLDATAHTGTTLTETCMMQPAAAVCALIFNHPAAQYFAVGPIGDDQRADYAARKDN